MVVDDEADVIDMLVMNLRSAGFQVITVEDGATALVKARNESPSLIILDLMLPKMPGLEICKVLKGDPATRHIPVIMLTAKAEEVDKIVGLELGADDYVTKPFSPRELVLRVKRLLRSGPATGAKEDEITLKELALDIPRHQASVKGRPIDLTATEFKLLTVLVQRRGRVQSRRPGADPHPVAARAGPGECEHARALHLHPRDQSRGGDREGRQPRVHPHG